jgi:hypothetical protein
MSDVDPTGAEVQQSEVPDHPAVKVQVETPVKVQPMGAVDWSTRRYAIDNTQAVRVAQDNPRRSRILITVRNQIAYIGRSQQEASPTSQGVTLPSPDHYEFTHTREIWMLGGSGSPSEIGVVEEFWTN